MARLSHIREECFFALFLNVLICVIFICVNGDDGLDLFSSTDDMKKLFTKEIKIRGKTNSLDTYVVMYNLILDYFILLELFRLLQNLSLQIY